MAEAWSSAVATAILDCYFNATNLTAPANVYIKLHTGAPGAAAAGNAATETTRKAISSAAASGGTVTSDAAITWVAIAGSQDATHFSVWDHVSAGNFLISGVVTANAYVAGDTLTIAVGDFDVVETIAS
jgi:hypothetical protein